MRRITRLWSLPAGERALLFRAVATVMFVRLALHFMSIEGLRKWAGRFGTAHMPLERIVWATEIAARTIPGTKCLVSALSLQRLLSAHGIASELFIGVALRGRAFGAHAWLVENERILIGQESHQEYTVLTRWTTNFAEGVGGTG